jgi:hypothetical protein
MGHDLAQLEAQSKEIDEQISLLAASGFGRRLGGIIHRPGWTTVAEFALVEMSLEGLLDSLKNVRRQADRLLEASEKVS